jgi:hypothetical protein
MAKKRMPATTTGSREDQIEVQVDALRCVDTSLRKRFVAVEIPSSCSKSEMRKAEEADNRRITTSRTHRENCICNVACSTQECRFDPRKVVESSVISRWLVEEGEC